MLIAGKQDPGILCADVFRPEFTELVRDEAFHTHQTWDDKIHTLLFLRLEQAVAAFFPGIDDVDVAGVDVLEEVEVMLQKVHLQDGLVDGLGFDDDVLLTFDLELDFFFHGRRVRNERVEVAGFDLLFDFGPSRSAAVMSGSVA